MASSGSEMAVTFPGLEVVSSCRKEVSGEKSSEDNDLIASSTNPVENESCPLDASLWNMLNDDLAEKIIASQSFKSFFRASVLSKAWSQKLFKHFFQSEVIRSMSSWESYSPLFTNGKKELIGYERNSQQWHKLATVLYFPPSVEQGPCPSLVEQRTWTWDLNLMAVGGSILCWMLTTGDACECFNKPHRRSRRPPFYPFYLCVSNPLTKTWKQLPPCPQMKVQGCGFGPRECRNTGYRWEDLYEGIKVHVDCQGTNAYQVILSKRTTPQLNDIQRYKEEISVYIFDSGSGIWTTDTYKLNTVKKDEAAGGNIEWMHMWNQSVYIDGVIYLGISSWAAELDTTLRFNLISFDLENKMWRDQNLSINEQERFCNCLFPPSDFWHSHSYVNLVVCGSNVMLVVFDDFCNDMCEISGHECLCVYRLDLEFGLAVAVSRAPKDISDLFMKEIKGVFFWRSFYCAAGVGDCIYFSANLGAKCVNLGGKCRSRPSLMYNVTTQKWDWIPTVPDKFGPFPDPSFRPQRPWTLTAYQPGLNPFLEV